MSISLVPENDISSSLDILEIKDLKLKDGSMTSRSAYEKESNIYHIPCDHLQLISHNGVSVTGLIYVRNENNFPIIFRMLTPKTKRISTQPKFGSIDEVSSVCIKVTITPSTKITDMDFFKRNYQILVQTMPSDTFVTTNPEDMFKENTYLNDQVKLWSQKLKIKPRFPEPQEIVSSPQIKKSMKLESLKDKMACKPRIPKAKSPSSKPPRKMQPKKKQLAKSKNSKVEDRTIISPSDSMSETTLKKTIVIKDTMVTPTLKPQLLSKIEILNGEQLNSDDIISDEYVFKENASGTSSVAPLQKISIGSWRHSQLFFEKDMKTTDELQRGYKYLMTSAHRNPFATNPITMTRDYQFTPPGISFYPSLVKCHNEKCNIFDIACQYLHKNPILKGFVDEKHFKKVKEHSVKDVAQIVISFE